MKVDLEKQLMDFEGKGIESEPGKPVTAKKMVMEALLATYKDEPQLSGEEKMKRWELAVRVRDTIGVIEISAEKISLVKRLVGKAYNPMVVGQVWKVLEGEK